MALINNKWRKDAGDNAVNAIARVGGVGLSAYVINQIQNPTEEVSNIRDTMIKISAPALALLGVAGDMFLSHPVLRAFCQGLYAYAVPRTVANFSKDLSEAMGWQPMPEFAPNTGTSGIGNPPIMNGVQRRAIMNGVGNTDFNPTTTPYVVIPPKAVENAAKEVRNEVTSESDVKGLAEKMMINN